MSRVGKRVIEVPQGVKVNVTASAVEVEGPRGKLATPVPTGITFRLEDGKLTAERQTDEQAALHGLARALVATRSRA
jgi:large subunit ribosomal protein L6